MHTLFRLAALLLPFALLAALDDRAPAPPRVGLSADGRHFALADSGRRYVPWGYNYLGEHGKLAEEDWHTPEGWRRIESDFREMRRLGANVVRWHLQYPTFMTAADRPDADQLARLRRLLGVARRNGVYLKLTGLNCFRLSRVPAWYDALDESARWRSQAVFWEAVAATCAGDTAVFAYDLMNEPVIGAPKKGEHPWLGGELGGFHFVQRISNRPAGRDQKAIAAAWVRAQTAAIRRHDPTALTTVGVIPWAQVWPTAKPVFYAPEGAKHMDFVSVHFYPSANRLEKDLTALAVYDVGKPIVVGETFPLSCSMRDWTRFIDAADRADGWIAHYFGHTPAEHRAGAQPGGAVAAEVLEYWARRGRLDVRRAAE